MWILYYKLKSENLGGINGQQHNIHILQKDDEDTDLSNSFGQEKEKNTGVGFIFLSIRAYQKGKIIHPWMKIQL